MDTVNPGLKTGDRISGFQIKNIVELPEIKSFFYELEHLRLKKGQGIQWTVAIATFTLPFRT